jgi:hypothetical protein
MCRPGQLPGTESVCFEVLGFDILIDEKLKPWVVEVNRCPSFGANQQIDYDIKSRLLVESFELMHLRASDRQRSQIMEKAQAKRRLYQNSTAMLPGATETSVGGNGGLPAAQQQPRPSLTDRSTVSLNIGSSNLNTASTTSISSQMVSNRMKSRQKEKRKNEIV